MPHDALARTAHAPAKLNFFFEVLGRRADGFHEIVSVAAPISLADTLTFTPRNDGVVTLVCHQHSSTSETIPDGEENSVVKMVRHLQRTLPQAARCGADIVLQKRIPSQAGLGGGSSDAATTLLLANEAWDLRLSCDELVALGAAIGSDVPLFLVGGASVSRGRGEQVVRLAHFPRLEGVVVKPRAGLATADVYRECMTHHDQQWRPAEPFLEAAARGAWSPLVASMFNRLESVALAQMPSLSDVLATLAACGGIAPQMSGSGTAVFALAHHARHVRQIAARLHATGVGEVFPFVVA